MTQLRAALQLTRVIQIMLLLTLPLYVLVGEYAGPQEAKEVRFLQVALAGVALADLGVASFLRRRLQAAQEALRLRGGTGHVAVSQHCLPDPL